LAYCCWQSIKSVCSMSIVSFLQVIWGTTSNHVALSHCILSLNGKVVPQRNKHISVLHAPSNS
jgi:hypothetical protein